MERHLYVAGAGVVGLVSAACYAEKGNFVTVYEKDEATRKALASGRLSFYEPKLDQLLRTTREAGHLEIVGNPVPAVAASDFSFVAVGTPTRRDGSTDLSAVMLACHDIAEGIKKSSGYHVLVIRSTILPGTTRGVIRKTVERFSGLRAGADFGLVAYPEFLREGSAIYDMINPDRIVVGQFDSRSGNMMEKFLNKFYSTRVPPILRVSATTAEMVKHASNAFLATKVAFINEIANLCERFEDVDVTQVADGMGYDPRIGREFLDAGLGFGGSCLPKDLKAFAHGSKRKGVRIRIVEASLASNELQPLRVIRLARDLIGSLRRKSVAVLGLSFKPGTSDMRGAPSVKVVRGLLDAGAHVSVYDPAAMKVAVEYFGDKVRYANDIRNCLKGAQCCFIVTEWNDFKTITSDLFAGLMARPVVIDGRRVLDPLSLEPSITYRAIGLGKRLD